MIELALALALHGGTVSDYEHCLIRDARGRISRSQQAVREFKKMRPCPEPGPRGTCPGWVIDHIQPLKRCGADTPSNMQWQTRRDAKIKDLTE